MLVCISYILILGQVLRFVSIIFFFFFNQSCYFLFFNFYLFIYFWLHMGFSSCGKPGLLSVAAGGLLIVVASLAAEHGFQGNGLQ